MKIINTYKHIKKVGLAYSGGLDTSTTIQWLNNKKIHVHAFIADLGQDSHTHLKQTAKKAKQYGAKKVHIIKTQTALCKEAQTALKCSAFAFTTGTNKYYNTTPLARVITALALTQKMTNNNIYIWCDGSTYKGNDIERFIRYAYLTNKNLDFYKPWLDNNFVNEFKGRKKMIQYTKQQAKYSIDSNLLGNTYEGGKIEDLTSDISHIKLKWCGHLNKPIKTPAITLKFNFKKGNITAINNKQLKITKLFKYLNKIGSKQKLGITDQIEERITGLKSRGLYEAPAMHILHNVYERAITCTYDKSTITTRAYLGELLGHKLYEGKWLDQSATLIKQLGHTLCKKLTGTITCKILEGKFIYTKTHMKHSLYNKNKVSMEHTYSPGFTPKDRIGQLNIIKNNLNITQSQSEIKKILNAC